MRELLEALLAGRDLEEAEGEALLRGLIDPEVPDAMKGALLAALRAKGETGAELRGMALAMRRAAVQVTLPDGPAVVDTCGTGGDGSSSFNVSTAAAILLAAAGRRVVKHGNRSVSSATGSADVLEALGVPMADCPATARDHLVDTNFAFLYAPAFHPATRAVAPVRRSLGVRTAFNLLGPLTNPAWPRHQLIGAYSVEAARLLADALTGMPIERCYVVHGDPGWDEATPCGPFLRLDVTRSGVEEREIDPLFSYGVARCAPEDLAGGDAAHNARLLRQVFSGARGPLRDAVLLNAALALQLTGEVDDPRVALARMADVVDSGRATWFLERLGTVGR